MKTKFLDSLSDPRQDYSAQQVASALFVYRDIDPTIMWRYESGVWQSNPFRKEKKPSN